MLLCDDPICIELPRMCAWIQLQDKTAWIDCFNCKDTGKQDQNAWRVMVHFDWTLSRSAALKDVIWETELVFFLHIAKVPQIRQQMRDHFWRVHGHGESANCRTRGLTIHVFKQVQTPIGWSSFSSLNMVLPNPGRTNVDVCWNSWMKCLCETWHNSGTQHSVHW